MYSGRLPKTLACLQAARAGAAILVVLFHTSVAIVAIPKYWSARPFGRCFDWGDSGVYLFFVLSGFIMWHTNIGRFKTSGHVAQYAWARFRRIYPLYWLVLALSLAASLTAHGLGTGMQMPPAVILSSFLLVRFNSPQDVMLVSWTLFHEVLFYMLFAVIVWRGRLGLALLAAWVALSCISFGVARGTMLWDFWLSPLHVLFAFGMVACWYGRNRAVRWPRAHVLGGVLLCACAAIDKVAIGMLSRDELALTYGLGVTLLIVGCVELERSGRLRTPSWLQFVGDASYSIYLVHLPALSLSARIMLSGGVGWLAHPMAAFVALACIGVGAGCLCHVLVERPLLRLMGGGRQRGMQRMAAAGGDAR